VPRPVRFVVRGSTDRLEKFLKAAQKLDVGSIVNEQAQIGARALADATPEDSGLAAHTWGYEVIQNGGDVTIYWTNSDIENGFPVAIMLQYGHGTGTGGYVQGRDYINPAIRPIFDQIADTVWKAVTSA
jgi:hypothetical protein